MSLNQGSGEPAKKSAAVRVVEGKATQCRAQTQAAPDQEDKPNEKSIKECGVEEEGPPGSHCRQGKRFYPLAVREPALLDGLAGRMGVGQEGPRSGDRGDQPVDCLGTRLQSRLPPEGDIPAQRQQESNEHTCIEKNAENLGDHQERPYQQLENLAFASDSHEPCPNPFTPLAG